MNILPKKRWHVRTKDNIARVRKDEAEAAAKAKEEQKRIENADREARLNVLRSKASVKVLEDDVSARFTNSESNLVGPSSSIEVKDHATGHINFFEDLEKHNLSTNKEHDDELKQKKEEYEKQIGYLTYLGQDTNEALKKKNWYELPPDATRFTRANEVKDTYNKLVLKDADGKPKIKSVSIKNGETDWKSKQAQDPINKFKQLKDHTEKKLICREKVAKRRMSSPEILQLSKKKLKKSKKKHRRQRSSSPDSDEVKRELEKKLKLQKLRDERIRRERVEREKANKLLTQLAGGTTNEEPKSKELTMKPKYNSQFNPELARQNYR